MKKVLVAFTLGLFLSSCQASSPPKTIVSISGATMGTIYRIKIVTPELSKKEVKKISDAVLSELESINQQMSHYRPETEISRFNALDENEAFPVSEDFLRVLKLSFEIHESTGGAFDITVEPLVHLWGFGPDSKKRFEPPASHEIRQVLKKTGQGQLSLTPQGALVKEISDLKINVSAIAKGYAVDMIAKQLHLLNQQHFMIEIGGEVYAAGQTIEGKQWKIGISTPHVETRLKNEVYKILHLSDVALATSGNYQSYFEYENEVYSHILDPRTGRPVPASIVSVSVIGPNCAVADAAATAVTVLGSEDGLAWIESQADLEALMITRTDTQALKETMSSGFKQYLQ